MKKMFAFILTLNIKKNCKWKYSSDARGDAKASTPSTVARNIIFGTILRFVHSTVARKINFQIGTILRFVHSTVARKINFQIGTIPRFVYCNTELVSQRLL